jgi:membrane protein implicated in regulation of membrane protease activity
MTDRFKRLAPLSGIVVVGLFVALFSLPSMPDSTTSGAKVVAFYRAHHTATYVGAVLCAYIGVIGALYFASLGGYLRRHGSQLLATTVTVGGAVFAVAMLLETGALAAVNDGPQHMSPDTAATLNLVQNDVFWPMMLAGVTIATVSLGVGFLRTKAVPTWLGVITTVVGVVGLAGISAWVAFMASAPLTLVIACVVYLRSGRPDEIALPDAGTVRATAARTQSATA